ncbi:hypothetical protein D9M68_798370 [compost metagenome]
MPIFGAIAFTAQPASVVQEQAATPAPLPAATQPLAEEYAELRIATYGRLAGSTLYVFHDSQGQRIAQDDLIAKGITVKDRGPREALLVREADYHSVFR